MDDPFPEGMTEEWEKFLSQERNFGDLFDNGLIFPLQRPRELNEMLKTAEMIKPKIVMEIGADKGGGLWAWCKRLTTLTRVIGCEIRGTPYAKAFEKAFPHIDFLWLEESSYERTVVDRVSDWLGSDLIDVLFIDGDKSMFQLDFDMYRRMVKNNGIVFMHDITDPAPGEAYQAVIARGYDYEEIIDRGDSANAMARAKQGLPSKSAHESWLRHWEGRSCGVGVIYMEPGIQ